MTDMVSNESAALQQVKKAFERALKKEGVEHYTEEIQTSACRHLREIWPGIADRMELFTHVDKVIVYWTSVFREKGILRAAYTRGATADAGTSDSACMQKLMIIDRDEPRHLLTKLLDEEKTSAEIVGQPGASALFEKDSHLVIKLDHPIDGCCRDLLDEYLEQIRQGNWMSISLDAQIANLANFDPPKVLIHPLSEIAKHQFSRIVYVAIPLGSLSFAGIVLGFTENDIDTQQYAAIEELWQAILEELVYPMHSAESRATTIGCPETSVLYLPIQGFARHCQFVMPGGEATEGYNAVIEMLKGDACHEHIRRFLGLLGKFFANLDNVEGRVAFWDYTEEIFWAFFDSMPSVLRKNKSSADMLRCRGKVEKECESGPLALLCRALGNELPMQELSGYRDHFAHSFHVFLIGLILMRSNRSGFSIRNYSAAQKKKMELGWLFAAMFHDVGYGVEKLESLANRYLQRMVGEKGDRNDGDYELVIPMNSHWGVTLTPCRFIKAFDKVEDSFDTDRLELRSLIYKALMTHADHGVVSAVLLAHSLYSENAFSDWLTDNSESVKMALSAIAVHNSPQWVDEDHGFAQREKESFLRQRMSNRSGLLRRLLICSDEIACMGRHATDKYRTAALTQLIIEDKKIVANYRPAPHVNPNTSVRAGIKKLSGIEIQGQVN